MKWRGDRQSKNVDDRGAIIWLRRDAGCWWRDRYGDHRCFIFLFSGGDLNSLPDVLGGSGQAANYQTENVGTSEYTEEKEFSAVVFGYLEDYWQDVFKSGKKPIRPDTRIIYGKRAVGMRLCHVTGWSVLLPSR